MTFAENTLATPVKDEELAKPESVWRLIGIAGAWTLLAEACAVGLGLVIGIAKAPFQIEATTNFHLALLVVGGCSFSVVLFCAAIGRARTVGNGDSRIGLAIAPIAGRPVIVGLLVAAAAYAALRDYATYKIRPDLFYQFGSASPWLIFLYVLMVAVLAPCAEELFFRGWLWVGLRRRWDPLPTALLTTAFWLLLHLERGIALTLSLLPLALLLALARQVSNSVRATIPLHAIYNFVVALPLILMAVEVIPLKGSIPPAEPTRANVSSQVGAPTQQTKPVQPNWPKQNTSPIQPSWLSGVAPQKPSAGAPSTEAATVVNREVFAGSESRIGAMNFVNADCSSGEMPEVRIVTPPANGAIRLQAMTIPIDRPSTDSLARCNGKPVEAMLVLYKSREGFAGNDTVVVDVDFRHGKVRRVVYNITIR